jgi:hypothetical protein
MISTCIPEGDGTEEGKVPCRSSPALLPFSYTAPVNVRNMDTVESLSRQIGLLVIERQDLRAAAAEAEALEENRRLLAAAQSRMSQLLIERYHPEAKSA